MLESIRSASDRPRLSLARTRNCSAQIPQLRSPIDTMALFRQIFKFDFSGMDQIKYFIHYHDIRSQFTDEVMFKFPSKGRSFSTNIVFNDIPVQIDYYLNAFCLGAERSRCAIVIHFPEGQSRVLIYDSIDAEKPVVDLPARRTSTGFRFNLSSYSLPEIVELLPQFLHPYDVVNVTRYYHFDLGSHSVKDLQEFALNSKFSEQFRVMVGTPNTVLCLTNTTDRRDWPAIRRFLSSRTVGLQQAMDSKSETGSLEVRFYSHHHDTTVSIQAGRKEAVSQVVQARKKLEHLVPVTRPELLRLELNGVALTKSGAAYSDESHYSNDWGNLFGQPGALILDRNAAYSICDGQVRFDQSSLEAELRHSLVNKLRAGRAGEMRLSGRGLFLAWAELVDDLRYIHSYDSLTNSLCPFPPEGPNLFSLFEWSSPFLSGHPLIKNVVAKIRQDLICRGLDSSPATLRSVDRSIIRHLTRARLRPSSPHFALAYYIAEDYLLQFCQQFDFFQESYGTKEKMRSFFGFDEHSPAEHFLACIGFLEKDILQYKHVPGAKYWMANTLLSLYQIIKEPIIYACMKICLPLL
ncbi:MAG: hypothetical protein WC890_06630 [Candidatus Margulisiibacteriota bacterium]